MNLFKQLQHGCEQATYTQGPSMTTLAYYVPVYDENGINTNPDLNTVTTTFNCTKCNAQFTARGNDHEGYEITQEK
jgi:hypothetical protein